MSKPAHRKFADHALREILHDPRNLEDLVYATVPELLGTLDFTRAEYLEREGQDARRTEREADVICKVDLHHGTGAVLCYILVEHQSDPLKDMPLRVLEYATQVLRQAYDQRELSDKRPLGILPIVFHTGHTLWTPPQQLGAMLDNPPKGMCPHWPIHYFHLEQQDPKALLRADRPFLNALAIIRVERSGELDLLKSTMAQLVHRIDSLTRHEASRFRQLMLFVAEWIEARLPKISHGPLIEASYAMIRYNDPEAFKTMNNKLGLSWEEETIIARQRGREEGIAIGEAKGEARGEARGEAKGEARGEARGEAKGQQEAMQTILLSQLQTKFGAIPQDLIDRVKSCRDNKVLQDALTRLLVVDTLADLQL